jgi:DNA-binding response OmpR family regulator
MGETATDGLHTVLVVDDDPQVLASLLDLLRRDGHEVMAAPGGREALALLAAGELPSLVIVDLLMPGMDGLELCRRLKAGVLTREIPVVIVSARIGPADVAAGEAAGASDYIKKPFDVDEVRLRVRVQLRLRDAAREQERVRRECEKRLRECEERYRALLARTKAG